MRKTIKTLRTLPFASAKPRYGLTRLKKPQLYGYLRQLLYLDPPIFSRIDPAAIQQLSTHPRAQAAIASACTQAATADCNQTTTAACTQAATAACNQSGARSPVPYPAAGMLQASMPISFIPPPHHHLPAPHLLQQQQQQQQQQYQPHFSSAASMVAVDASSSTSPTTFTPPAHKKQRVKCDPEGDTSRTLPGQPSAAAAAAAAAVPGNHTIASLPNNNNPDEQPQTPLEARLLHELRQMGFTDSTVDILASMRRLSATTVDAVMCDLVSQREEAAEARRMDQARLLSLADRQEEAARRRRAQAQQRHQERMQASWDEWRDDDSMFPHSWLLSRDGVRRAWEGAVRNSRHVRAQMLTLLELEQKSRKWYGEILPRAFFELVLAERLGKADHGDRSVMLDREIQQLKRGLFTLSNQQGGVPKLLLNACDAEGGGAKEDSDVMVVATRITSLAALKENALPTAAENGTKSRFEPPPEQVIEIL